MKFWAGALLVSAEVITNMALFVGLLSGAIYLIRPGMRKHKKTDLRIFELIKAHTNERNTRIMSFFTFFGTHKFFIPANLFLIFYFLLIRRRSWFSIRVASIAISSLGLMFVLKYLFKRKRPLYPLQAAKGLSFPSGHAIMSVTFYGLLMYVISQTIQDKPLKWSLIVSLGIFVQLIGFSRVYLRVHYASDVAVGYITGSLWLLISLDILKRIEHYVHEHNTKIAIEDKGDIVLTDKRGCSQMTQKICAHLWGTILKTLWKLQWLRKISIVISCSQMIQKNLCASVVSVRNNSMIDETLRQCLNNSAGMFDYGRAPWQKRKEFFVPCVLSYVTIF